MKPTAVGHPVGATDRLPLFGRQLGDAVDPIGCHAAGRAGVDHARATVRLNEVESRRRSVIRKAQDRQIDFIEQLPASLGILAHVFGNEPDVDVCAGPEQIADAQSGGPLLAVDIDAGTLAQGYLHPSCRCE